MLCSVFPLTLAAASLLVIFPYQDAAVLANPSDQWPHTPWSTHGREIVNSKGDILQIVGTNWPGSLATMIPEGLQHASASSIVSRLAKAGFNFVRHTYAIQMIDEILDNGDKDVTIEEAFVNALGTVDGTRVLNAVLSNNNDLGWKRETPRMQVWSDIANLEHEAGLVMHLDNHVSKAQWCCSTGDGNAFFGDRYFDVQKWLRGLAYMATWAKDHPNIASMSLRNELRRPDTPNDPSIRQYNWVSWAGNVTSGADMIHQANPDLLIFFSGLSYDLTLAPITTGSDLNRIWSGLDPIPNAKSLRPKHFQIRDHAWRRKAVFELHLYAHSGGHDMGDCESTKVHLYQSGFNALGIAPPALCANGQCHPANRLTPVILSELGQAQDATLLNSPYLQCLRSFTLANRIGWAQWSIAGSYYLRSGKMELNDPWGLFNPQWSKWRQPLTFPRFWGSWIKAVGKTNLEKDVESTTCV